MEEKKFELPKEIYDLAGELNKLYKISIME